VKPTDLLRTTTGHVMVTAHRGAMAYAPENTFAAFRLAKHLGAEAIELDVHLTADDRLIVHHDDTLDRTTNGTGFVRDRTWDEIAGLSAGAWFGSAFAGERVPLLEDVLDWARSETMRLSIELKRPNAALGRKPYPELSRRVVEMVQAYGIADNVVLFSDDHAAVREVHRLAPDIATSITLGGATYLDPVSIARAAGANGISIYWMFASRALVEQCHAAMLHVFGFGVSEDPSRAFELEAMLANGTDFVSSGAPDRMRQFVETWERQQRG
jgi:glycerophosphoryl diester phosphodiesterase